MTVRPDPLVRSSLPAATVTRWSGNAPIAIARLRRIFAPSACSVAWRDFMAVSPVWRGGVILLVIATWTMDAGSVSWAKELPSGFRGFFGWITDLGKSGWILYPTALLCLLLLVADWRGVSRRIAAAWTEVGIIAGFLFLSIAGSGILANVVKQFVGRARPRLYDSDGAFGFLPFQFDYAHASFPSGHATTMGALAVVVAVVAPRLTVPAALFCGSVALSRVVVGAHYPSDVVGGFLLGAAFAWLCALAFTEAGIGFARDRAGTIRARVVAIRRVFWRPRGFRTAAVGLWSAIVGSGSGTARP